MKVVKILNLHFDCIMQNVKNREMLVMNLQYGS